MTAPDAPPPTCPFCYRTATKLLQRHRRGLIAVLLGRPRAQVVVCDGHLGKGLERIRAVWPR